MDWQIRFLVVLLILEFATITAYRASLIEPPITFQPVDVYLELFRSGIVLLVPLAIVMRLSRQTLGSIGIRRGDESKMIGLGLAPSLVGLGLVVLLAQAVGAEFAGLTPLTYGFAIFLPAGFSEEIVWRGYVQTRLIARTTVLRGLLLASLLFSLWHLPVNFLTFGGILEAFAASLLYQFPIGLALGYMMVKSQNILPSSIFHHFINWTRILFPIP